METWAGLVRARPIKEIAGKTELRKTMSARILVGSVVAIAAWGTAVAFGQETDRRTPAAAIAPFVDNQTVTIVHIDLAAFDATAAINVLADVLDLPQPERDGLQADVVPLNVMADSLPEGAHADVFVVTSISDLATLPVFFVVPRETQAASAISLELRRTVASQLAAELATEQIGDAQVTGSPRTIERLKKAVPAQRPEIAAAFKATGASAMKLLFVPSADARRAIEFLIPKLPPQLGGGPTKGLTANVVWVALAIDLPPAAPRVRVIVQATGKEGAAVLARQAEQMLATLIAQGDLREAVPNIEEAAKRLVPKVSDDRLTLELDAEQIAGLRPILLSLLSSAEDTIAQRLPGKKPSEK